MINNIVVGFFPQGILEVLSAVEVVMAVGLGLVGCLLLVAWVVLGLVGLVILQQQLLH